MTNANASAGWKNLFEASLAVAPPLDAEVLAQIPARRGVFLLAGEGDEPVSLLTAADMRAVLRGRLAEQTDGPTRRADLRQITRRVWWRLAHSHFETDWRFGQLARAVFPRTYPALLSFKPAWFVHVDPREEFPGFRRLRETGSRPGRYYGPFPDGRSAARFIDVLMDVFDLCRCEQASRRRPGSAGCVYREMGRCLAPCDGGPMLDEYRLAIERACRLAAGERQAVAEDLAAQMRRLAAERRYERAAVLKGKLDRLEELQGEAFRHVGPLERFRWLLIQSGPRRRKAKAFFVDRGEIVEAGELDYPSRAEQAAALLERMGRFASDDRPVDAARREGIALVSHYLFTSLPRQGLILRFDAGLGAEGLCRQIESAAERLRLKAPKGRSAGDEAKKTP